MSNLDDLMQNAGSLIEFAAKNPQIVAAAASLLSSKEGTVGGATGLEGLASAFGSQGLGDALQSWVGSGSNQQINPGQLSAALGDDTMSQFASKAGIGIEQAGPALAAVLPGLIDGLTPQGNAPEGASLESALAGMLGGSGLPF